MACRGTFCLCKKASEVCKVAFKEAQGPWKEGTGAFTRAHGLLNVAQGLPPGFPLDSPDIRPAGVSCLRICPGRKDNAKIGISTGVCCGELAV